MLAALIIILVLLIVFAPQFWVKHVMQQYSDDIEHMPGTGGELAQHLIDKFKLDGVKVESLEYVGDHYDPDAKAIRLSEQHFNGKSLTAITIAAHEFGHALQHADAYQPLILRTRLAKIAAMTEKYASIFLVSLPFLFLITRIPILHLGVFIFGFTLMTMPIVLHLITLPVEFNASFDRALPILEKGNYLPDSALPAARKILIAAAMTYVAASLASLLNVYRWIAILRR